MYKIINIIIIIFISLQYNKLKAEAYMSASIGTSSAENFKLGVNDELAMTGSDSITTKSTTSYPLIGKVTQTQTQTTTYESILKNFILASQNKYNFTFSSAMGYKFKNLNLRTESEYRYIKFKSFVSSGRVDAKVDIDIDVEVKADRTGLILAQEHQSQHIELPIEIQDMLDPNYQNDFLPNSIPVNVSFSHGAHLQFFNLLYDANVYKNLVFFAGAGVGFGFLSFYDVTYPEDMEVTIYPIKSRFFVYQTKLGASYNVYKNVDFLLTYSNIRGFSATNIGSFSYDPLKFQTIEFGLRYNFS